MLLCHVSATEAAARAAVEAWPGSGSTGQLHLLPYGRSHSEFPAPPQTRLISLPDFAGSPAARASRLLSLVRSLRRPRYDVAVVSQPMLALSRARGLLLAFPFVIGARTVLVQDPSAPHRRVVRRGAALAELARWILLHIASEVTARLAARLVSRLTRQPPAPVSAPPQEGSVVYLRTDLDLALGPLRAGGSASHTDGVLRALVRKGFAVEFWSTGAIEGLPDHVPSRRLPYLLAGNMPTEVAEFVSGLAQFVRPPSRSQATAFVYQRYSLNNLAGLLLARRWKVPLILEANASEADWRRSWATLTHPGLADACERLLLCNADRVVTVSRNAADGLLAAGASPGRVRVIPNGVDVERFAGAEPTVLDAPKDAQIIGFVGLFYPWHGVRYLAEAFVDVHRERPNTRLLLVGDGEDRPLVRSILRAGGVLEAAIMPGMVSRSEVPRLLAAADVLVSPHAPNEGFVGSPIKIFEYMAAGRAIVASSVGQMSELLRDGTTALLVPAGDAAALSRAIGRLCDDDALRDRLGGAAAAEARRLHSWDARIATLLGEEQATPRGD